MIPEPHPVHEAVPARFAGNNGDMDIDEMYGVVGSCLEAELEREGLPAITPTYWMIILDRAGIACSVVDASEDHDGPTHALQVLFDGDRDVVGAALVSFVRPHGVAQLLASVAVRNHETSDLRRATLVQVETGAVAIGEWEYTI
jgi:hypothetical protein